jgi:hypothetical protein
MGIFFWKLETKWVWAGYGFFGPEMKSDYNHIHLHILIDIYNSLPHPLSSSFVNKKKEKKEVVLSKK